MKIIYIDWIDIPNKNSCGPQVKSMLKLQNDLIKQTIYFPEYDLAYDPHTSSAEDPRARTLIELTSNTRLIIPKTIRINTNSLKFYEAIFCESKHDIVIMGGGEIVGDVRTHIYDEPSEFGHGMKCVNSDNVLIKNISFKECIGDGFCTSGTGPAKEEYNFSKGCTNLSLINCTFDSNRRQGVSLTCAQNGLLIDKCRFINTGVISYTAPGSGIDFEPNGDYDTFFNCKITNCVFSNNKGAQFNTYSANFDGLLIDKCQFISPCEIINGVSQINGLRCISFHGTFKNSKISRSVLNADVATDRFRGSNSVIEFVKCDLKGFYTFDLVTSGTIETNYLIKFNKCIFNIDGVNYRYAPFFIRNSMADLVFNHCKITNNIDIQTSFGNLFFYRAGYGCYAKFEAYDCVIDLKDKPIDFTVLKNSRVRCGSINNIITKKQGVSLINNRIELTSNELNAYFKFLNANGLNEGDIRKIQIEGNSITATCHPSMIVSGEPSGSRFDTTGYDLFMENNVFPSITDYGNLQTLKMSEHFHSVVVE